jgi:hypothetical protein
MSSGGSVGGFSQLSMGGTNPEGIILVWDLDQTLISGPDGRMNDNALACMNRAFSSPKFTANFLLTNNSSERFINMCHIALTGRYNELFPDNQRGFLFDIMYTASQNPDGSYKDPRVIDETVPIERRSTGHAAKRLEDVKTMLNEIDVNAPLDPSRVFFFDDLPNHIIRTQLPEGHYIQITPPFNSNEQDTTNYSAVDAFLAQAGGASRRYKGRKSRKGKGKKAAKKLTKKSRSK